MSSVTTERWARLKALAPAEGMLIQPVAPDITGCLLGVDDEGHFHLLVAVAEEPLCLPQELEAVAVRVIETDHLYLDVHARAHYEMIFTPIVNQIFAGVFVQRRKPVDVVVETIEEFRAALKPLKPTLTLQEQIGLVGELWVLRHVLLPSLGSRACSLWSGPDAERHDFIGDRVHIEVKTTTRSEDRHEISRIDQLRAPDGKKLLFASIQLEKTEGGAMTLATLIDAIVIALGADGRAIEAFEAKLAKTKWHDGLRQAGELRKFNLREVQFFLVDGSFPRLPDDYIPPRGITAIRYTIDVSSRSVLDRDEVAVLVDTM